MINHVPKQYDENNVLKDGSFFFLSIDIYSVKFNLKV